MQQKGSLFENPKERHDAHLKLFLDAREESRNLAASLYVSLGAAEDQAVHAAAHVAEVAFVATFQLGNHATRVADFRESLTHGRPIHVAVTKIDPGISVFFALEVFQMNLDDALAEGANPVLRKSVKHHVADVEPSLNPRALELADVTDHFERAEQKLVPHFLDGNHDFQFLGKRNQLANLPLRACPCIAVGRLRIHHGGNEQHRI